MDAHSLPAAKSAVLFATRTWSGRYQGAAPSLNRERADAPATARRALYVPGNAAVAASLAQWASAAASPPAEGCVVRVTKASRRTGGGTAATGATLFVCMQITRGMVAKQPARMLSVHSVEP